MGANIDFFLSGKAHVYYGLTVLMGLAFYGIFALGCLLWVFALVIAVGALVDLWAHSYRH